MSTNQKPDDWTDTKAADLVREFDAVWIFIPKCGASPGRQKATSAIAQALRDAIAAERKACAEVARQKATEFLSPEYAVDQPLSSFSERFACEEVAKAIEARTESGQ